MSAVDSKDRHMNHAARLAKLEISHRACALELGEPKSVVSRYFKDGHLARRLAASDFAERIERYLDLKQSAAGKSPAVTFSAAPMSGHFKHLGISLLNAAEKIGVEYLVLKRGIFQGKWPSEATHGYVNNWIEQSLKARKEVAVLTKQSLPEEVVEYFGLRRDPFSNEIDSTDDIFESKDLRAAEKRILLAVDGAMWVAITGDIGSGKTTLIKGVKSRLKKRGEVVIVEPRTIEKQFLGASHICDSILNDLGAEVIRTRHSLEHKARLVARTLEEAARDGRKVVLLVDEAHLIRDEALLALKRIYEFESGFKKLMAIVLVGQQVLARRLKNNFNLAEVSQRADLYELGALNGTTGAYVRHKLDRAGAGDREIFDTSAIKVIAEKADTPLGVNNVSSMAMLHGWDLREAKITAETVRSI